MTETPAFELEKGTLVLFLQAEYLKCKVGELAARWLERRSLAIYEAETRYDERGRPIPDRLQPSCTHGVHVLEGWHPGEGVVVSCYICYGTFYWSMKQHQYQSASVPGPLRMPSREALEGFLGSSQRYCPDFVDGPLASRLRSRAIRIGA